MTTTATNPQTWESLAAQFGGSGLGCFARGTSVWTPQGFTPIENISVGDLVYAFDDKRNITAQRVYETSTHLSQEVWQWDFWGGQVIATPNHLVLNESGGFEEFGNLEENDSLWDSSWSIRPVGKVTKDIPKSDVFNLRVENCPTYFVTSAKIAVHNGGTGKASSSSREEADEGKSTSRAVVTELISEGPIEGLAGGLKGVYLDKTPIENPNGSRTAKGFNYAFRRGVQNQKILPDYADQTINTTALNLNITKAQGPYTRSIVNGELDAISVTLQVELQKLSGSNLVGNSVEFKIFIKEGSGPFVLRLQREIKGKYPLTEFQWKFPVDNVGNTVSSYQVRVEKVTTDSTSTTNVSRIVWKNYGEIINDKLTYRNSSIICLQFLASQFNAIPERGYKINGRTILIPSNATVNDDGTLTFSGLWNGTMYQPSRACGDPIWIVYDLLTNKRYGLGKYFKPSQIDLAGFYKVSVYNNGMVPDFLGGMQARYNIKTVLQSKEKAVDVLNALLSSCFAKMIWWGGKLSVWQDRPEDPSLQFTNADVDKGQFIYASTAYKTRATMARVTWNDPDLFFERSVETVEDEDGLNLYGVTEVESVAFGCWRRGQAIRHGRHILYSSQNEIETVSFKSRAIGRFAKPGDVVKVADSARANVRYGGLVKSGTTTLVELDAPVTLVGSNFKLSVLLPNGTTETRGISNGTSSGSISNVTVSPPFSQAPLPESNWLVTTSALEPQLFRVLSVSLDDENPLKTEITAISYNPGKWNDIEYNVPITPYPTSLQIPAIVSIPRNLGGFLFSYNGTSTLIAQWQAPELSPGVADPYIRGYLVSLSQDGLNWLDTKFVPIGNYEVRFGGLVDNESYRFRVIAVDIKNKESVGIVSQQLLSQGLHPDTIRYKGNLSSLNINISDNDLLSINIFVKGVYEAGIRSSEFGSIAHYLTDCCPFAGDSLNGVKLWWSDYSAPFYQTLTGTPGYSSAFMNLVNYTASDFSRARGLDPGNSINHGKAAFTNAVFQKEFIPLNNYIKGFFNRGLMISLYITKNSSNIGNGGDIMCGDTGNAERYFQLATNYFNTLYAGYAFESAAGGSKQQIKSNSVSGGFWIYQLEDLIGGQAVGINLMPEKVYRNGILFSSVQQYNFTPYFDGNLHLVPYSTNSIGFYGLGILTMPPKMLADYYNLVRNLMVSLGRNTFS